MLLVELTQKLLMLGQLTTNQRAEITDVSVLRLLADDAAALNTKHAQFGQSAAFLLDCFLVVSHNHAAPYQFRS